MTDFVGAEHQFHSKDFAVDWAERFEPTPERLRLFALIASQLKTALPPAATVVELGIGPGYLANHLLEQMPGIAFCGIDFSQPMLDIAGERLQGHAARVSYLRADLVSDSWDEMIPGPVHAIVSTWALHDLGSPENVEVVYRRSRQALGDPGILLNGDFIKPSGVTQDFEGGRFLIEKHLKLLLDAGFSKADCLSVFEEELDNPTAAQNYACIRADR